MDRVSIRQRPLGLDQKPVTDIDAPFAPDSLHPSPPDTPNDIGCPEVPSALPGSLTPFSEMHREGQEGQTSQYRDMVIRFWTRTMIPYPLIAWAITGSSERLVRGKRPLVTPNT